MKAQWDDYWQPCIEPAREARAQTARSSGLIEEFKRTAEIRPEHGVDVLRSEPDPEVPRASFVDWCLTLTGEHERGARLEVEQHQRVANTIGGSDERAGPWAGIPPRGRRHGG